MWGGVYCDTGWQWRTPLLWSTDGTKEVEPLKDEVEAEVKSKVEEFHLDFST